MIVKEIIKNLGNLELFYERLTELHILDSFYINLEGFEKPRHIRKLIKKYQNKLPEEKIFKSGVIRGNKMIIWRAK